jgi:hypothetical protein
VLYAWAKRRTVVVSQRMPATTTTDALALLERSGFQLLRTWQHGADRFQRRDNRVVTEGFLDRHDQQSIATPPQRKMN